MVKKLRSVEFLCLIVIISLSLYLRLWQVNHLFKWISDYDEGAYSLGGRFIAQGYLPYKDFTLVHPPLYDLVLAGIYKIFGYDFLYGRYFSVLLSVVSIVLVFLIAKNLYNRYAGLAAAASFSLFPGFFSIWYRAVQEALGITLILGAIYLATDYIMKKEHGIRLVWSGLCLGLAMAVKYTFIPAALAFMFGIGMVAMEGRWNKWRSVFRGLFCRDWWLLTAGIISGFFLATGFFLIRFPREFISQTLASQLGYRVNGTPYSIIKRILGFPAELMAILRLRSGNFEDTVAALSILLIFCILAILIARRNYSRLNRFMIVTLFVTTLLCSFFSPFGTPRYFISAYVFTLVAMASFIPVIEFKDFSTRMNWSIVKSNIALISVTFIILFFTAGTLKLRLDYNYMGNGNMTYEEDVYKETIAYLERVGAKQIYSLDPIIPALSTKFSSSLEFDTFGQMFVIQTTPSAIVKNNIDKGADYILIDSFTWLLGLTHSQMGEITQAVRDNATLVETIVPGDLTIFSVEIYKVSPG